MVVLLNEGAWVDVKPSCSERGPVDLGIKK
jgi:hypothetical protein